VREDVLTILSASIQAAKRMKTLLIVVALLYIGSYLAGWYLISVKSLIAVQTSEALGQAVTTQQPFTSILESLRGGELLTAIVMTFLYNLAVGAFLTTTLPGIVPLIGSLGIAAVSFLRGFVVGITYPEILASTPAGFALGMGTMILELGAYVFSGAAGVNIALAPIFPRRYGVESRWASFKMAWKDAARVFIVVIILLALGLC